ncbi:alanine racemase [uncultured Roseibium sp.]|uniref:alanine racemase n=1 Tax=uncultured Roseibium sp. TaxID=1936171 RepID=UPI002624DFC9|nr:alanine racemase [uncultured Roseibium sp.]
MIKQNEVQNEPLKSNYGLNYDLDAMIHNAKHCLVAAKQNGFELRAVLKGGYILPEIVERLSDLDGISLAVGTAAEASLPAVKDLAVATLYPSSSIAIEAFSNVVRTTKVGTSGMRAWARGPDSHRVLLAIETGEKREGLDPRDLRQEVWTIRKAFGNGVKIDGFQLNYGCVAQKAPDVQCINVLLKDLAQESLTLPLSNPVLSLGGSALLPVLDQLEMPAMFRPELRIGEAIVTGSIPGEETNSSLRRTTIYKAEILQVLPRNSSNRQRVLINVGSYVLDVARRARQTTGVVFESIGSQISVVALSNDWVNSLRDTTELQLDYSETERALLRHQGSIGPLVCLGQSTARP